MYRILFFLLLTLSILPAHALVETESVRLRLSDSIKKELPTITDPRQRINALYNIFDLAPQDSVVATGERLLNEAINAKDYTTAYDMFHRLSSFSVGKDSTLINKYMDDIKKMPHSAEKDATECFIYLCAMTSRARYSDEAERYKEITSLINRYKESHHKTLHETDINDRVVLLFTLCNYLDLTLPGEVMTIYLEELDKLIKKMPFRLDGLDNMFFLHSAMVYTYNDQSARAISADRELLKVIDRLDRKAKSEGRIYRDYDRFRYSVYRRMLLNADALAPVEVEHVYNRILNLRSANKEVEQDMINNPRAEASYLMAKGRYTQAIPLLKKCLEMEKSFGTRRKLLRMLVKAANETGNKELLTETAIEYNTILEETLRERTLERGQELKALYDVTDIQEHDEDSDYSSAHSQSASTIAILAVVLLIAFTTMFLIMYRKTRKISTKLMETNNMLTAERDNLRRMQTSLIEARDEARKANRHKNDFISNMSHEVSSPLNTIVECSHILVDNVSDEKRHYLDRFARTIDISAEVLRTLINDVLEISNAEAGTLPIQKTTVPLRTLCVAAMENARLHHSNPNVELRWANEEDETQVIYTDARRVEQVLVNLLLNGLKFTESGFVELSYKVDPLRGMTTFMVTDTGIGVPDGKEELIFDRFVKLSPMSQGAGLGLSICRMITELLKGKIYVDTTYKGPGTRFIFTIPSSM